MQNSAPRDGIFETNFFRKEVARLTGLEPATPGVTGRYSNQLSYNRNSPTPDRSKSVGAYYAAPRTASSGGLRKMTPL